MNTRNGFYSVLALVVGGLIVDRVLESCDNAVENGLHPKVKMTQDGISVSTASRLETIDTESEMTEISEDTET